MKKKKQKGEEEGRRKVIKQVKRISITKKYRRQRYIYIYICYVLKLSLLINELFSNWLVCLVGVFHIQLCLWKKRKEIQENNFWEWKLKVESGNESGKWENEEKKNLSLSTFNFQLLFINCYFKSLFGCFFFWTN